MSADEVNARADTHEGGAVGPSATEWLTGNLRKGFSALMLRRPKAPAEKVEDSMPVEISRIAASKEKPTTEQLAMFFASMDNVIEQMINEALQELNLQNGTVEVMSEKGTPHPDVTHLPVHWVVNRGAAAKIIRSVNQAETFSSDLLSKEAFRAAINEIAKYVSTDCVDMYKGLRVDDEKIGWIARDAIAYFKKRQQELAANEAQ